MITCLYIDRARASGRGALLGLIVTLSIASIQPKLFAQERRGQGPSAYLIAPKEGALLVGDIERWWQRAKAWYQRSTPDQELTLKEKRAQMRPLSRALGRGCYGCHTKGFKGYNDKGLISAQMMAISAEHDVSCDRCHVGARGLTKLGARALLMWRYSVYESLDCLDCHPKGASFKTLN